MTKGQLIKAIEDFPDDVEIYMQLNKVTSEGLQVSGAEDYYDDIIFITDDVPDLHMLKEIVEAVAAHEEMNIKEVLEEIEELIWR